MHNKNIHIKRSFINYDNPDYSDWTPLNWRKEFELIKEFISNETNLYNPYNIITIEAINEFGTKEERIEIANKFGNATDSFHLASAQRFLPQFITKNDDEKTTIKQIEQC